MIDKEASNAKKPQQTNGHHENSAMEVDEEL
jgi:hypothetical protein